MTNITTRLLFSDTLHFFSLQKLFESHIEPSTMNLLLTKPKYMSLLPGKAGLREHAGKLHAPPGESLLTRLLRLVLLLSLSTIIFVGVFLLGSYAGYKEAALFHQHLQAESCDLRGAGNAASAPSSDRLSNPPGTSSSTRCQNASYRIEWRALSFEERTSYIDAVNCLARTPSVLGDNGTIYDDFAFVHNLHAHSSKLP